MVTPLRLSSAHRRLSEGGGRAQRCDKRSAGLTTADAVRNCHVSYTRVSYVAKTETSWLCGQVKPMQGCVKPGKHTGPSSDRHSHTG